MRYATSLKLLCNVAEARGLNPQDCLAGTGLTLVDIGNESTRLTLDQEAKAIENLVRMSEQDIGLGSDVGNRMHVHAFGIWGFAILTSPTLRTAIDTAIRFIQLSFVIADMRLTEDDGQARLVFDMQQLPETIHGFLLERHAVVAVTFIREILQLKSHDDFVVESTRQSPDYIEALSAATALRARGNAGSAALLFPQAWLDKPLPKSDPQTLQYCLRQCESLLERIKEDSRPWSAKVRDVMMDHIGEEIKIQTVAQLLNLTERTLRRRLTDEGSRFRDIYSDVRLSIAYELLETTGMATETVSWRVGYAESASFIRAFTKKFSKKPKEVRNTRLSRAS
ncbi:AraC family transcriptional regulator ligand-binding domain-containing protein [Bacterioplanoides sp.]|uniref:AraC family transcriptional regulator ligand-binding domain-containing protein n=1 Tax=Bacterioplanoides sp. TaxID=2066072 RepID=UPI003B0027A5